MAVFLSQRGRVLSGEQVRVSNAPVVIGGESADRPGRDLHTHSAPAKAHVTVIRKPGAADICQLRIECDCGEIIVLDLDYDQPGDRERSGP
ncbi:MAG: hypothetical protein KDA85_15960 [Planctomycetaceae bacterium]|nr:hypothetical protein [Planctomycetaceae bacterium]